jgi:BlaI family penicillinase repressor
MVMAKSTPPRPTDAELSILRVLWRIGPATVRQAQDELNRTEATRPGEAGRNWAGYTTVLKFLQIMTEKGLVDRDESQRTHVYRAKLPEDKTQRQLVRDLLDRAFSGSAQKLVMQALSVNKASPQELAQIRELLDRLEEGQP